MIDRLDEPGTKHHVMVHAVDGQPLFRDYRDREWYLDRAGLVIPKCGAHLLTFDFSLDTHLHMQIEVGVIGLESIMRRIDSPYASYFNFRWGRRGHLMMDDFRSKLIADEPYARRCTRYIIRNPIEAGVYRSLDAMLRNPLNAWGELIGWRDAINLDRDRALLPFGGSPEAALTALKAFMVDPNCEEERRLFEGWEPIDVDGRAVVQVLGPDEFVMRVLGEAARKKREREQLVAAGWTLERIVGAAATVTGRDAGAIIGGRAHDESKIRSAVAWLAVEKLGIKGIDLARAWRRSPGAISHAIRKGERAAAETGLTDVVQA